MNSETTQLSPDSPEKDTTTISTKRDYTALWLLAAVVLYFALQLWILPAIGIST